MKLTALLLLSLAASGQSNAPKKAPPSGEQTVNGTDGQRYVWIPAGKFTMGCSEGDSQCSDLEKPAHDVEITKGFWLGQTAVTVGAWKTYVQKTGKSMPPEPEWMGRALNQGWQDDQQPIVNVSWEEASAFCQWGGGRLPTEAEWEYAARAGTTGARYGELSDIAWYGDNSGKQHIDTAAIWKVDREKVLDRLTENENVLHPVGLKQPNAWKLFDMLGNVRQWTADWLDVKYYDQRQGRDPMGPSGGQFRALRGGNWYSLPAFVRVSDRFGFVPGERETGVGLRCAGNWAGAVIGGILGSVAAVPPPSSAPASSEDQPRQLRIRVGGNVQQAKLIRQPPPIYPPLAKQARISGVVKLDAIIGKDGTIQSLSVVSGHPLLVPAAMEAAKQWVYQTTLVNGEPVEVVTQIEVNFTLSR